MVSSGQRLSVSQLPLRCCHQTVWMKYTPAKQQGGGRQPAVGAHQSISCFGGGQRRFGVLSCHQTAWMMCARLPGAHTATRRPRGGGRDGMLGWVSYRNGLHVSADVRMEWIHGWGLGSGSCSELRRHGMGRACLKRMSAALCSALINRGHAPCRQAMRRSPLTEAALPGLARKLCCAVAAPRCAAARRVILHAMHTHTPTWPHEVRSARPCRCRAGCLTCMRGLMMW